MATDPMAAPDLTSGSASDSLKSLLQLLGNRSTALDPGLASLTSMSGSAAGAFQNAINNQNTSMGLSPEAMSALRTQGTSGINDQYQSAAQALNSNLLRRGAAGQGVLPGSGGDISRAYQPLYSAMEAAKTKANTDTIMADEAAKRQSLYQNQQLALGAANNVFGNQTSLFNAGNAALGQAGSVANALADLEGPNLLKLLGTSLATGAFTGTGPGASLVSGGGTNGTGNFGVLGDLLGQVTGSGGGGSTDSLSNILNGITNGSYGGTAPFAGSVTDQAGQAAAHTAPDTAKMLTELLGPGAAVGSGPMANILSGIGNGSFDTAAPFAGSATEAAGNAAAATAPDTARMLAEALGSGGAAAGIGAATGAGAGTIAAGIGTPSIIGQIGTAAAETSSAGGGLGGALGLGGGSGMLGLGALTIPVIGGVALAIGLLAKHYWGNGPDRMAANQLTGPGGVHDFFTQATAQAEALPEGPERESAYNVRDRAMEQALLGFSKIDKNHYYQAKQTLQQFSKFSTVQPLLG